MNNYSVKGSSINSKIEYVEENMSADDAQMLKDMFSDRLSFPVLDSAWYDYELYVKILREIARVFFASDRERLKDVGIYSAQKVLSGVYKAYMKGGDFIKFLQKISMLHSRFYNKGRMDVSVSENKKTCTIVLSDAPVYAPEDNYIAAGFYMGSAMACGLQGVTCGIVEKGNAVGFELKWE